MMEPGQPMMQLMMKSMPICHEAWHVPSKVSVLEGVGGRAELVMLDSPVLAGTVILTVRRTASSVMESASWDTLQIGVGKHARFGEKALKLNHARDPNSRVLIHEDRVEIVARRDIPADTALSFNYNSTEYRMAEPFTDWETGELVGGFSQASEVERKWLLDNGLVLSHVLLLRDAEEAKKSDTKKGGAGESGSSS